MKADLAFTLTGGEGSDDARFQWTGSLREGDDPAHERRAVFTSRVPWRKAVRIQRKLASPSGPAVAVPAAGSDLATWEWIDAGGPPVAIQLPEASSGSGPTGSRTGGAGLLRRWRLTASFRPAKTK